MKSITFLAMPSLIIQNIDGELTTPEKWIAFSPILLFLLIVLMVFLKLKKDKVSLKDLLLDKDANVQIEVEKSKQMIAKASFQNQEALQQTAKNDENPETQKSNTSVSRFLAFISGLISVGLACIITTFFMWNYFLWDKIDKVPDLDKLLTVLLTLGIGVIPYAFNKISTAVK